MGGQAHVVLKMFEVVTDQLGDDPILLRRFHLQFRHLRPRRAELLLKGLDTTKLFGLHDHRVVCTVHRVVRLQDQIS